MQLPIEEPVSIIQLLLTPHFDGKGEASAIEMHLRFKSPRLQAGATLGFFTLRGGNVESHPYKETDIQARDEQGTLHINFASSEDEDEALWKVDRATHGDLTLRFVAFPREATKNTPMGARMDMRRDQGGLQASGVWFLPRPATQDICEYHLDWNLSKAPPGTRAVWSFGEGNVVQTGANDTLTGSVYMVGPIRSDPDPGSVMNTPGFCGMYWFGDLYENFLSLTDYNAKLFAKMCEFFSDPDSTYRVFVRKVPFGHGGTGFNASYVLEYDEDSKTVSENDLVRLYTHEMIHSWAIINPTPPISNGWFDEGIAEFYSAWLPYRFGFYTEDYLAESINCHLQAYFTNPLMYATLEEAEKSFFDDWYAEHITYKRGFVYFLHIYQNLARQMNNRNQPWQDVSSSLTILDKIIIDLSVRYRDGEQVQQRDWIDELAKYMDRHEAETFWENMRQGRTVMHFNTNEKILGTNLSFIPVSQELMQFGIARSSSRVRIVTGVEYGSRADIAGIKNGDKIVDLSKAYICVNQLEETYKLYIERDEKTVLYEYWPRSFTKVKSWQVVAS